ncbi:hypothetical protein [Methylobacterium aerolatum]|uniref:Lipoprotein n=1 Tax=Methylobacterium aerolatum TaxID=418708 RepID=A0ABU0HWH4_9HYPH|nr:hypothetical protein [Methylobacterium aerolatum]MDQ0446685.1 hypothetical protein [Methylobacterium aerolatum]GJD33652.1 hypothetical protein FMGBMHLM_0544 [Methylobacterium aerolatum]
MPRVPSRFAPVRRRSRPLLLAAAASVILGACAQQGDFGRPKAGAWNSLIDATGAVVARERGEPSADAPFTDDEQDLRSRAWRFLMPADTREAFLDILANLTRARVLPPSWRSEDPARYHDALLDEGFRSPVSRYRRLTDDAVADARLVPPFTALAARVADADARRLRSLPFARTLKDDDIREAAMRVAENRCLVAWVRLEAGRRLEGYRYALEHLFAEAPDPAAAEAERALAMLAGRRPLFDPLLPPDAATRCGFVPAPAPVAVVKTPLVTKD